MSHLPRYRPYHPALHRERMPLSWWMHRRAHVRFILRELTSVFVMGVAVELVLLVRALAAGPDAYAAFMDWLVSAPALALHVVSFAMVVFHSITWFGLAPKAMVVRVGARRVSDAAILGANYAAWFVSSMILLLLLLA